MSQDFTQTASELLGCKYGVVDGDGHYCGVHGPHCPMVYIPAVAAALAQVCEERDKIIAEYKQGWLSVGEELVHWQNRAGEQDRALAAEQTSNLNLTDRLAKLQADNTDLDNRLAAAENSARIKALEWVLTLNNDTVPTSIEDAIKAELAALKAGKEEP